MQGSTSSARLFILYGHLRLAENGHWSIAANEPSRRAREQPSAPKRAKGGPSEAETTRTRERPTTFAGGPRRPSTERGVNKHSPGGQMQPSTGACLATRLWAAEGVGVVRPSCWSRWSRRASSSPSRRPTLHSRSRCRQPRKPQHDILKRTKAAIHGTRKPSVKDAEGHEDLPFL